MIKNIYDFSELGLEEQLKAVPGNLYYKLSFN